MTATTSASSSSSSDNNNNPSRSSPTKTENGNSLMVAIVDQTVATPTTTASSSHSHPESYRPVRLPSPSDPTQEQDYLLVTTTTTTTANGSHTTASHLMELQTLDSDNPSAATAHQQQYQAWFVGNTVVANGKLYVVSRVDPLFWMLARIDVPALSAAASAGTTSQQQPWQPLDQLLVGVPTPVQQALDPRQMQHLAATYNMGDDDDDDDEVFYKWTLPKIMAWLDQKQQSVVRVLEHQLWQQLQHEQASSQHGGGAFCAGFSLRSEPTAAAVSETITPPSSNTTPTLTAAHHQQAKHESLQIVCNYLSPSWQTAWLEDHLQLEATTVLQDPVAQQAAQKRIRRDTTTPSTTTTMNQSVAAVTPVAPPAPKPKLSFGHKQLLKVNKKGMKPMTSFFAAKPKK